MLTHLQDTIDNLQAENNRLAVQLELCQEALHEAKEDTKAYREELVIALTAPAAKDKALREILGHCNLWHFRCPDLKCPVRRARGEEVEG